MTQPVIGDHFARGVQYQTAERVSLVGIGIHAPVRLIEIFIHGRGHINQGAFVLPEFVVLFAVNDIGTCSLHVVGRDQNLFGDILHGFNVGYLAVTEPVA